jgi:hypothetical protein
MVGGMNANINPAPTTAAAILRYRIDRLHADPSPEERRQSAYTALCAAQRDQIAVRVRWTGNPLGWLVSIVRVTPERGHLSRLFDGTMLHVPLEDITAVDDPGDPDLTDALALTDEGEETRERAGMWFGKNPQTLSDEDIERFARLEARGGAVRRD